MLDLILGDPETWNHPVRRIGNLIQKLTDFFLKRGDGISDSAVRARVKRKYGRLLVAAVLLISGGGTALLLVGAYTLHPWAGCALEGWLTYRLLAARNLRDASMRVYRALQSGSLEDSRYAVSMIVGRDTTVLDETGVTKAAVETVAENTSDGVIAPMLYMALGGPVLGMMYKAVNTMDSMVGYRNDKYMDFGRAAARLDDGVNFIPARISGLLMVAVAFLMGFWDRLRTNIQRPPGLPNLPSGSTKACQPQCGAYRSRLRRRAGCSAGGKCPVLRPGGGKTNFGRESAAGGAGGYSPGEPVDAGYGGAV